MTTPSKPDKRSSAYDTMSGYWTLVQTMLGGVEAMRLAGQKYLPKMEAESTKNYNARVKHARFTNVFRDIVENLASKPFSRECVIAEDSTGSRSQDIGKGEGAPTQAKTATTNEQLKDFCEDVDAQNNSLHVFASNLFFQGIADAVSWVLVDHTQVPVGATVKEEKDMGARPYWVHVPATRLIAVHSDIVEGKEQIVDARMLDPEVEVEGFDEVVKERVRHFFRPKLGKKNGRQTYGPAQFMLWEKQKDANNKEVWVSIDEGAIRIGVIPLVPFVTGRRKVGSWVIDPPLRDAAELQVEHYQLENGLKYAEQLTCFPMLAGNGVAPPKQPMNAKGEVTGKAEAVAFGPGSLLFAPPNGEGRHGTWNLLEIAATSLKFLLEHIESTAKELRELGRQPLTANSGNLTVVTTQFAAQKGNSAVQAWAIGLKDCLEQCLLLTAQWLKLPDEPEVSVFTDFSLDSQAADVSKTLLEMRKAGEISRFVHCEEQKRRGVLSAEYDFEADQERLAAEAPDPDSEEDLEAATTPKSKKPLAKAA